MITQAHNERSRALGELLREHAPVDLVQRLDNAHEFPHDLHARLAQFGVFGLGTSEIDGGSGGDAIDQVLALRSLGSAVNSLGVFTTVMYLLTALLRSFGSDDQKSAWLRPLISGDKTGSFCLTEAGSGTDILASLATTARRTPDGWRLDGRKRWVSCALRADFFVVVARTDEHRTRGLTMFVVPKDKAGVSIKQIDTFALNSVDVCDVEFAGVIVTETAVLGEVNQAFAQVIGTLNAERVSAAAAAAGIGFGALDQAVRYAKERQAFGRNVGQFQAVQHRLTQCSVELECAWLMVVKAASDLAEDRPADVTSSMAKLAASQAVERTVRVGMEIMGANGFETSGPMQRYYRDSRLYAFAPLANDMVSNLIAERWLGLPRSF